MSVKGIGQLLRGTARFLFISYGAAVSNRGMTEIRNLSGSSARVSGYRHIGR